MIFLTTNFPKSGNKFKAPRIKSSNKPEQVEVVRASKGKPTCAFLYDGSRTYICPFALDNQQFKKTARQLKIKGDVDATKKVRPLIVKEVPSFDISKKRLTVYPLDTFVHIVERLKEKDLPVGFKPYVNQAYTFFHAEQNQLGKKHMAELVSSCFKNPVTKLHIDPDDILRAERAPRNTFLLDANKLDGGSIHEKVKELATALKLCVYLYQIEPTNAIIGQLHDMMRCTRAIKRPPSTLTRRPNPIIIPKTVSKDVKTFAKTLEMPSAPDFERLVNKFRSSAPIDAPEVWKSQKKNDLETFRAKIADPSTFRALEFFFCFKNKIFGQSVKTWPQFIQLMLTDARVCHCVRFYVAGLAVAKAYAETSKPKPFA
eukprot:g1715.t1